MKFENYAAKYPGKEKVAIEKLNFDLERGHLLGVIGPVGAGKSTLLNCLIGETELVLGQFACTNSISVAPQEPWVFEGTVKENILLGHKFDQQKYDEAGFG